MSVDLLHVEVQVIPTIPEMQAGKTPDRWDTRVWGSVGALAIMIQPAQPRHLEDKH